MAAGASPNALPDEDDPAIEVLDWTPLHHAVRSGREDIARVLLDNGANVDPKDDDWRTPLSLAIEQQDVPMIQLLWEDGANLRLLEDEDVEDLERIAKRWRLQEILDEL